MIHTRLLHKNILGWFWGYFWIQELSDHQVWSYVGMEMVEMELCMWIKTESQRMFKWELKQIHKFSQMNAFLWYIRRFWDLMQDWRSYWDGWFSSLSPSDLPPTSSPCCSLPGQAVKRDVLLGTSSQWDSTMGASLFSCHLPSHTSLTDVPQHCFPGGSLGSSSGMLF